MTNVKSCTIKLLNKTYEIKCPENEEDNLKRAAKKLQAQMTLNKGKFKTLDPFQNLLLASLDVSRELIICKSELDNQRKQVSQFITSLENKINHMVNGDPDFIPQTD
jgi:cell division protein ZapA